MKKLINRFDALADARRVTVSLLAAFVLFLPFLADFIKFQTALGTKISVWIEKHEKAKRN